MVDSPDASAHGYDPVAFIDPLAIIMEGNVVKGKIQQTLREEEFTEGGRTVKEIGRLAIATMTLMLSYVDSFFILL